MDFLKSIVSGASYGATAVILSHPFDTVKTVQQASGNVGTLSTLRRSVNGVSQLYRGFIPALSGSIAFRTLPFVAYNWSTERLNNVSDFWSTHTTLRAGVAGASGGALRSALECPLEVTKVCRQVNVKWRWNRLYSGMCITLLRNMSVIGLFWSFADVVRPWCASRGIDGPLCSFIIGGGCSTTAWAIVYPLDVIKSRVQSESMVSSSTVSISSTTRAILRTGWRSIYAGLQAGLLRSIVANGGAFVVYDYVSGLLL
jgi:solute carrier family 25 (mitochondrial carnitine/acylcarnitine transporter), member 20/29